MHIIDVPAAPQAPQAFSRSSINPGALYDIQGFFYTGNGSSLSIGHRVNGNTRLLLHIRLY